jgi:hypothetical protein
MTVNEHGDPDVVITRGWVTQISTKVSVPAGDSAAKLGSQLGN